MDFSIEFLPEDLLPPIFNEDLYYSNISSKFSEETILDILPSPILAHDGDTELNAPVVYNLVHMDCSNSFKISKNLDGEAVISWVSNIQEECPKMENVNLKVMVSAKYCF